MKKDNFLVEMIKLLAGSLIIVAILINFVLMPCIVDGSSMYPTLEENEFGYSFIFTKALGINRFDIAVIKTDSGDSSKLLVKRVIGLPNETIEYKDNRLYVNGEYVEEPFLNDAYTADFKETLQNDEYFCMGDNRSVSRDSRFYGPFSSRDIKSTHLFVIYPFSKIGLR